VALLVVALVGALTALDASSAVANDLGDRIGSARRGQSYYESVMLQADRVVAKLDRHRDGIKRDMKRAGRKLKRTRSHRADARKVVQMRKSRVALLQRRAPKEGEYVPKGFAARLRRAQARLDRAQKVERRLDSQMGRIGRTYAAKHRRLKSFRRTMRPAIGRREAAEAALAYLISSGTRLAQQRAALKTVAHLGPPGTFVWPTLGSVTQGYGCTGFAANPRRGSCRHFHDGLDISPSGGTRIGTVATGVVAYAGWNPWDAEGRAFIVVVGHADGYVSRYGHLVPNRRVARAGKVVYRGETVGYMGSTGNSTGVHLHVEILRNGATVDPTSLLPDRGKDGKVKKDRKKGARKKGKDRDRKGKHHASKLKGNGKRGDANDQRRRDRVEDVPDEATVPPTVGDPLHDLTLEACAPTIGAETTDDADVPPTLSDLADRLQSSIDACLEPEPESAEDPAWGGGTSPWDLTTLDAPRVASPR
jgi:murein DD-endopeptidase MepM/ murein hydrolase activator NlpD